MEDQNQTSFTFVLDNLPEKKLSSPKFSSGGWEWFVNVYPKDDDHYFFMCLTVANPQSLSPGMIRQVSFFFVMLNQSGKEIYRTKECCKLFCAQFSGWGFSVPLPGGFFETNKLILKVELVKVVEVVDWNEMLDFNGFQVHYSQAASVNSLYKKHRDCAINIKLTNQLVKTTYMNLLLGLIKTLEKPPHSLTETELSNVRSELVEASFKLNWLKKMLDEVSLEGKKENIIVDRHHGSSSRVEEHIKDKVKAARDWLEGLVHSWKGSLGFAHLRNNEKID